MTADTGKPTHRRLPVPLVLAAASAMVCVGIVAWALSRPGAVDPEPSSAETPEVRVDTSSPSLAAESFLDAWRKRAHGTASELSVGDARAAVDNRKRSDDLMSPEERAAKQQIWDQLADSRLALMVDQSEELRDGRVVIHGTAEGAFLEHEYARRIDFVLRRVDGQWKVEDMQLGDITSDVPDFLEIDPSVGRDPSEFEIRGEDVP